MRELKFVFAGVAHVHSHGYAMSLKELKEARLVGVYDHSPERAKIFGQKYGATAYENLEEMFRRERPDAVIVASENARHAELAVKTMENGIHILCEKPITTTLEDAKRVVSAARRAGVVFQTCFVMRYHSATLTVKELLEAGAIGEIRAILGTNRLNVNSILVEPWFTDPGLSGGGAIMDHTAHLADIMRWYTGSEIESIYTETGANIIPNIRVEDNFLTIARFRGNKLCSIDGSWCFPDTYPSWGEFTLTIYGSDGMIAVDAFRQNVAQLSFKNTEGGGRLHYYSSDPNLEMIKDFVKCIIDPSHKPRATAEDGYRATEATVASYMSAREGRPVALPL
ncbi:MAG: Gfo/Idh/MocA family oxidoreductase [Nitrososphaerota archaeon]|nr:Gfo/Idh/MocA family oxidoreductase [Candidatus Calditenuaceae archaeon]MDW8072720.1 Gfo/Idh/MocA family oxidoreductase [Nitrososphaerota archaeon]